MPYILRANILSRTTIINRWVDAYYHPHTFGDTLSEYHVRNNTSLGQLIAL